MFDNLRDIANSSWQAFERNICRLLLYMGFSNVRLVGQRDDHGADVTAIRYGKKWLFQAKHWKKAVGDSVLEETLKALYEYKADIPVVVASMGFDSSAKQYQQNLMRYNKVPMQLWDASRLVNETGKLPEKTLNTRSIRKYQESAIKEITGAYFSGEKRALVVLATGLGKTFVAAESIRRIRAIEQKRVLVCAHTNDLVYQLERAFWPFLKPSETTLVWNNYEPQNNESLENANFTFACVDTVYNYIINRKELPLFDILLVDECHHVGSSMYDQVFDYLAAGKENGAFALGLTATPWRADEVQISKYFGEPKISVDIIDGLKNGFLANIDYRIFTNNIDWNSLKNIKGKSFSPKQINKTLFINQWDDSVVDTFHEAWNEQTNPRAIIFCGTIEHAITMKNKINALGFCRAEAIYSNASDRGFEAMGQYKRNRILSDFDEGNINVICAVDIFNEGIDVPDVNILVFQRVTHSRRIFIQQLGRGLRLSEGKDKVIVLDFVSDIRRFAAGLSLKDSLSSGRDATRIDLPNKVTFYKVNKEDSQSESFLRQWLEDVVAIESSDEDASVLKFPPAFEE